MNEAPELRRGLGPLHATLLTIGAIVGTGIFFTAGEIATHLPHAGLILLVWVAGGLLTLAGALTFAELGAAFPLAGGIYHYLKEAYGPLWGFLYGWLAFLVNMSGGIAAIAVGFGMALGVFLPFFSGEHVLLAIPAGAAGADAVAGAGAEPLWTLTGSQLAAVLAIVLLTAVNHLGLGPGARVNSALTLLKILAIAGFAVIGLLALGRADVDFLAPLPVATGEGAPFVGLMSAFGAAMIAALWTYDGWFGLTASAGELQRPERNLPLGLIAGVLIVIALYLGLNIFYLCALPLDELAAAPAGGQTAATAFLGQRAGNLFAAVVVVSSFGCLAGTILYSSRIYVPMARDGLFFRKVGEVHPRWRTPVTSLWLQSAWAIVLTLTGGYEALFTYAVFASLLIMLATGAAVFVLRRKRPDLARPYRVPGYPFVPLLFLGGVALIVLNTLVESPTESLAGLGLVVLGLPAYAFWRRRATALAETAPLQAPKP
ncbi:MAG: APC family permease [Planctomycetota bacterium]